MHLDYDKIKNHIPEVVDFYKSKKYAIAITLVEEDGETKVLFEERAHKMTHQPGDVCLPGGRIEKGETPEEAVIREMCEELLVTPEQLEVIGPCDIYFTGKGVVLYPYVVKLTGYTGTFNKDETEAVFTVPLSYFGENEPEEAFSLTQEKPEGNFPFERVYGGKDYPWREHRRRIVFYQYEKWTIWGMTGRIMESFVETFLK